MSDWYCGIDFGTSNSSVAMSDGEHVRILELDSANASPTSLPSLLYITNEGDSIVGRAAANAFIERNVDREVKLQQVDLGIDIEGYVASEPDKSESYRPAAVDSQVREAVRARATVEVNSPGRLFQSLKTLLRHENFKGTEVFGVSYQIEELVAIILRRIGARLEKTRFRVQAEIFTDAASPAALVVFTIALHIGLSQLALTDALRTVCVGAVILLIYISLFWYVFNLVSLVEVYLERLTEKTESELDDMMVPLIRKTMRIFIFIVGFLVIAENVFGQNIGTWLAGLGIAGLAVSLAAQDSIKNVFGSLTILFDRPFKVGDRIKYAGHDGPVEEIGFRSTKIRTLTGHLVTVPNSRLVNDPVENIAVRPSIRRILNVTVTYDTPREKIQEAIDIIKGILEEPELREPIHQKIGEDEMPPRVYFNDFNAASLNIIVIYWYIPPDYWGYMEHAQKFNLRLFEAFEKAGIEFAFPTQTLYLANDEKRQLAMRMLGEGQG